MSVAFRREGDEEHLEPRFALPIPPGPNLVTARGLKQIQTRHDMVEASLAGQLSEDERKTVLREARYWRQRLASAQLAPRPDGNRVAIGTRVSFAQDGGARTVDVVGHDESEPAAGRIAFTAPLARALLDAQVGDEIEFAGSNKLLIIASIQISADADDPLLNAPR
jgi:transcription elongation GreA/GreB family factor